MLSNWKKRKGRIIGEVAEAKLKIARGQGLVYEIKNSILIAAGLKIIFEFNLAVTAVATILILISFYVIGYIDINKVKLFQAEAKISTGKYNPFFNNMNKKINKK